MIVVPNEGDTRYYRDDLGNGTSRCRDSATGQFAPDAYCAGDLDWALRAEGLLRILQGRLALGPGVRFGGGARPYGTAVWATNGSRRGSLFVKGSAGEDFVQFDVGVDFGW
jgi:hypothetical protein